MIAIDGPTAARLWRPQQFGNRRAGQIDDPLIEPFWSGPRVLALIDRNVVSLRDGDGDRLEGFEEIEERLVGASRADTVLVEGHLTGEPIQDLSTIAARDLVEVPRAGAGMAQLFVGDRSRRRRLGDDAPPAAGLGSLAGLAGATPGAVAFVAVDLLWLDDEPLVDIPLLERKRVLESVLDEGDLIRIGIHVRPPVDSWLGSWRQFGFSRLAYKAANSRYLQGRPNPDWSIARLPAR